ncbi:MAG: hypothetical protein U9Q96_02880 [Patescibacteria group bacterium]|nr:hypothetical protein [Patescibacteria group bacterium]
MKKKNSKAKAWIVDVNMGYGHQRTSYPLRSLAPQEKVIHANDYDGIPNKDKLTWELGRKGYEFISKFKRLPLIGDPAFKLFDNFQKILDFYPKRDLSKPNIQLKQELKRIKMGCGKDLIERLGKDPLPFVTSFFTPAYMAEAFNYPNDIYSVICDADISRTWASLNPSQSRIKYFTPNTWTTNRLKLYGIKEENIFLTGYPLPLENIGTSKLEILKKDLKERLFHLDPKKSYFQKYKVLIEEHLGTLPKTSKRPLTIMFAVGGAGAQKEIGIKIAGSLKQLIKEKKIKLILVAGIREEVKKYFLERITYLGLKGYLGDSLEIVFAPKIEDYFDKFNLALRKTDILWTKPSELSFYAGLGLPIIIAPIIGSQESFNRKWLLTLGSGVLQENPVYTHEWLFDFLDSGRLAEAAMQGFIEAEKLGTLNIQKIIAENY